jgi:hypothetical protein
MQVNLRLLLDYLDDRLDSEATRTLGDYLAEHEKQRQLVERMRRVVRRRRLTTPDVTERSELPPHHTDDPNAIAAYLDGALSAEDEAQLQEICLDTDVYLAEVTACHQILCQGESGMRVPPLARHRMYGLVKGPEGQALRVVSREPRKSKPPLWEVDGRPGYEEEDQRLLEPLYHDWASSRWRKLLPVAALILAATLIALVVWNLPGRFPVDNVATGVPAPESAPIVAEAAKTKLVEAPNSVPFHARLEAQVVWPTPVMLLEGQPKWRIAPQAVGEATGLVAARPAMLGMFFALGQETDQPEPVIPLPRVEASRDVALSPQRDIRVQLGLNAAEIPGMFLHRLDNSEWNFLRPQARVISNEKLMALPGYTGTIALQTQVRLILVGQFTSVISSNPYAETVVELHPSPDADLDVTLQRGRIVIVGRPETPDTKVRLRYQDKTWEFTLHPNTEIGIQAFGKLVSSDDDRWELAYRMEMIVGQSSAEVRKQGQTAPLALKSQLSWNGLTDERKLGTISEIAEVPTWISKRLTAPKEAVGSLVGFRSRVQAKLAGDGKDENWLRLACEESLEERQPVERQEAILIQAAIDNLPPLVRSLSDQNAERRRLTREVLIHWLGQQEERVTTLLSQFVDQGYSQEDAKLLLALYRGPAIVTPALIASLLQQLNHSQLAIRDQAWQVLSSVAPERPSVYDPTTSPELRAKSIEVIKTRLAKPLNRNGATPPPPP